MTSTKAYAPYVDVRQDKSNKDICSHGSYGLKHYILWLDRAAFGASFPKMERAIFLESDQCLFSFIQKETDWQSKIFEKMAGTPISSTIDPIPVPLK